jgi:hypothetical protein
MNTGKPDNKQIFDTKLFSFDWKENRGLDLHIIEWEERVNRKADVPFNPVILEMGMALYAAFRELRVLYTINAEAKPGIEHSFYQVHFEKFAHMHFLSIAVNRVLQILKYGFPDQNTVIRAKYLELTQRINNFRDSLEHQTEISRAKNAPAFFNNMEDLGYRSIKAKTHENLNTDFSEIEKLLNTVMAELERA